MIAHEEHAKEHARAVEEHDKAQERAAEEPAAEEPAEEVAAEEPAAEAELDNDL